MAYHTSYAHTTRKAAAVTVSESSSPDADSLLIPVNDIDLHWDMLELADTIVFGDPTVR